MLVLALTLMVAKAAVPSETAKMTLPQTIGHTKSGSASSAMRVLWNALTVRLPAGTREEFQPQNLGLGVYRFSTPDGQHAITIQYDVLDPPGFLKEQQMRAAHSVPFGGLRAWRYVHDQTVSIQVNLPNQTDAPYSIMGW